MKKPTIRSKRVVLPGLALVAAVGIGGTVWTATASDEVKGDERDRVGRAAVDAVGGGTAVDVEAGDDRGEAYEVEVRAEDGTEHDVILDEQLDVVSRQADDSDDARDDEGDDADDRQLTAAERAAAEKAALGAVGGGTVLDVEASDDRGVAFEVEVRDSKGVERDVELDSAYAVLSSAVDD